MGAGAVAFPFLPGVRSYWFPLFLGPAIPSISFPLAAVSLIFLFSTAYLFLSTLHHGIVRTTIHAGPNILIQKKTGLFGTQVKRWPRSEISDLAAGPTSVKVLHKINSALNLQHHSPEMGWLAAVLRIKLGLAPYAPKQTALPAGSKLIYEDRNGVSRIEMPPDRRILIAALGMVVVFLALTFMVLQRGFREVPGDDPSAIISMILFLLIVCGTSILLLFQRMRLPTIFEISAEYFSVTAPSLLGQRRRQWRRDQIEMVSLENKQGIYLWLFRQGRQRPIRLGSGINQSDVRWVVETIRYELQI
jgi:hypothetical protein